MEKMEFNKRSLTTLARSLANVIGAEAPMQSDVENVPEIEEMVKAKTANGKVDRMLIYNPDAIGEWYYEKYKDTFANVEKHTDIKVKYITANPPKTPVCFGTMFTGASPEVHGIQKYEKPVITIDTLFDSWSRSGLKVAMVAVANQSIPKIFAGRDIDYYLMPYDKQVVEKALELIKEDKYDVIEVYNQEYDDVMHMTHPESIPAKRASRHYVESFDKLMNAVDEYWQEHDTFVAFSTDHGTHRMFFGLGLGMHGSDIPKDRNIVHFYGIKPKTK